jgi:hypothetical protein
MIDRLPNAAPEWTTAAHTRGIIRVYAWRHRHQRPPRQQRTSNLKRP